MPVIPNLRATNPNALQDEAPPVPLTYVDSPDMDYVAWLSGSGDAIASIPNAGNRSVAVIGSGAAGLAAAYELLRCGLQVSVFEATDRVGGRLFSSLSNSGSGNIFEMGAMRFTPSERVLHYYCDKFNKSGGNIQFDDGPFPDPGDQDVTYIAFQGQTYVYTPDGSTADFPPSYARVNAGWKALMDKGFDSADGTIALVPSSLITKLLAGETVPGAPTVQQAWQGYIDHFGNSSLYEAMLRIFTDPNAPGGEVWEPIDFEFFGALGTGFGGFGPLFSISFLDILRFVINAVDSNQHELLTGVQSIVEAFLIQPMPVAGGGTMKLSTFITTDMPVTAVTPSGSQVQLSFGNGDKQTFDRVVVATSHRSMELTMGLGFSQGGGPLATPVADAVRRLHLANSSKVFVETAAFWDQPQPDTNHNWPRNVVGDTILRNLYALTYPDVPGGSLLFSYTWEEDSVKQQTYPANARLGLLLRDLATISQPFAAMLKGAIQSSTVQIIDWQKQPYYYGAFKLNLPGQDPYVKALFYDFQKARNAGPGEVPPDCLVYLAGDSIGYLGGWVENALETGVNAAAGVAVSLGGTLANPGAGPFEKLDPETYNYGTAASAVALSR